MKRALITGVTGQDGSYLAELLLDKGYEVYGVYRRKSQLDYGAINHLLDKITLLYGDMTDPLSLTKAVSQCRPDEVYNLAAQSFIGASFDQPVFTAMTAGLGVAYLLDAIRCVKPDARFYQASTSELFGGMSEDAMDETSPFYPRSPYGAAKAYGHWMTINYRESYDMFACAGILFNHESERRGREFVTRKISGAVARIKRGELDCLELGNLSAKRDWGHSRDYVRAMWLMLQRDKPEEFIIATGENHTVREFADLAFRYAGYDLRFEGEGADEVGLDVKTGRTLVRVNPKFFRPAEVDTLLGNPAKAKRVLGWTPEIRFEDLVRIMVEADMKGDHSCANSTH
jgi:GDPmannose 4,6-dehydratase